MVLRGAQFQRFGLVRCALLTRRAFSSHHPRFMQEQSDAFYLSEEGQITCGYLTELHGEQFRQSHNKGLASYSARG